MSHYIVRVRSILCGLLQIQLSSNAESTTTYGATSIAAVLKIIIIVEMNIEQTARKKLVLMSTALMLPRIGRAKMWKFLFLDGASA